MKYFVFILCFPILFSCSAVNKIFHKEKSRIDSTSVIHERSDSSVVKDSASLKKEGSTSIIKIDSAKEKESTSIQEDITEKEFDTTGKIKKETHIKRTIEQGRQKETVSSTNFDNHSKTDSTKSSSAVVKNSSKNDSTHTKAIKKNVVNEVQKNKAFQFLWWLLLLVPAYIAYRNWPKIKAVAIHLMTGL